MALLSLRDLLLVAPAFNPTNTEYPPSLLSHHHHPLTHNSNNPLGMGVGVGVGVIPLLTTGAPPCFSTNDDDKEEDNDSTRAQIQLWQQQQQQQPLRNQDQFQSKRPLGNTGSVTMNFNNSSHNGINNNNSSSNNSSSCSTTCQDCGNQAKKDCSHRRCRTCCKSRGFFCSTHIKSTWIPAARRRDRQQQQQQQQPQQDHQQQLSGSKKPRTSSQTTTTSHTSTDTGSTQQDANLRGGFLPLSLPGYVRAPAVFKCVRVTAIDEGEDQYAYQTVVKIDGHVFKGFLYDQGIVDESRDSIPGLSDLHLGNSNKNPSSLPLVLDPPTLSHVYGGTMMGVGPAFGNPMN